MQRDGSHFYGTVVRRDANSITLSEQSGEIRTFLLSDLSDMQINASGAKMNQPVASTPVVEPPQVVTPVPAGGDLFQQPEGTRFAITTNGFLDSCCLRMNDIALGVLDVDIKDNKGVVMIPKGANVTFMVKDQRTDGGLSLTLELSSADYGGHHYLISSAQGGDQPGAVMTLTGARDGSTEAAVKGKSIHVDDNSAMIFRAATPVVFKLST
jgi:hypothetical protein